MYSGLIWDNRTFLLDRLQFSHAVATLGGISSPLISKTARPYYLPCPLDDEVPVSVYTGRGGLPLGYIGFGFDVDIVSLGTKLWIKFATRELVHKGQTTSRPAPA